jgi:hypothetical protein
VQCLLFAAAAAAAAEGWPCHLSCLGLLQLQQAMAETLLRPPQEQWHLILLLLLPLLF